MKNRLPKASNSSLLMMLAASLLMVLLAPIDAMAQKSRDITPAKQPNFIFIQGEGQGWSSTSVEMGGADAGERADGARPRGLTPNLEKLAAAGVRMSDFYATCPRCTPARASYLTGISPAKLHMTYVNEGGTGKREAEQGRQPLLMRMTTPSPTMELPDGVKTTGDVLREIGYATAHFGKWHVGRTDPTRHGFDVSDGANTNQGPERGVAPNPKQSVAITDRGIAFMREQVKLGKPFFIQMSHYGTGAADEVTPEALERTSKLLPRLSGKNLAQAAGVVDMDTAIGRVLAAIDELGIADSTYIFFSTDHGTPGGGGGMKGNGTGANAPLAGAKGSVREGGIRVPFMARGPGIPAGKVIHERGTGMDLLPTMLDLAGKPLARSATPDAKTVVEGGSLVPVLKTGGSGKVVRPREEIVMHFPHYDLNNGGPASAIFLGDYKLIRNYDTGQVMLFDIRKDIAEEKNLAGEEPERVTDLEAKLDAYLKAVNAQMPSPKDQTTTDSPTQPTTQPTQDQQIQEPAKKGPGNKNPGNKNPGNKDKKNQQNKKPKPADKGTGDVAPTH